jgi:hypothetical protein
MLEAAQSKDILADLIDVGIEALVQARCELPAFSTLRRAAQKARAQVNWRYYHQVAAALNDVQRATIARPLTREAQEATSLWQRLKREPKRPATKRIREHITHARWLQSLNSACQAVEGIPETKLQRFAEEARALDTSSRPIASSSWISWRFSDPRRPVQIRRRSRRSPLSCATAMGGRPGC